MINVGLVRDEVVGMLKDFLGKPPRVDSVRLDDDEVVFTGSENAYSTGMVPLCGCIGEYIDGLLREYYGDRVRGEWVHLHYDYKYTITIMSLRGSRLVEWLKSIGLDSRIGKWLDDVDRLCGVWLKIIRLNYRTNEVLFHDEVIVRRLPHRPSRIYTILGYTTVVLAISSGLSSLIAGLMGCLNGICGLFAIIGLVSMLPLLFASLWLLDDCPGA